DCRYAYSPKSNIKFWKDKFRKNQERDRQSLSDLRSEGWDPLVIWECETRDAEKLQARIAEHLGRAGGDGH
ncbi:MAG: very short patch repair endonuclease, partial [Geminicoccaceae bacterium]